MTDSSFSQRLKRTWNSHAFLPSLSGAAASENSQFSPATSEGLGWGWLAGGFGLSRMANSAQIADTSPASFLLSRKALENHRRRRRAVGCAAHAASAAPCAGSAALHYGKILKILSKNVLTFVSFLVREIWFNRPRDCYLVCSKIVKTYVWLKKYYRY